MHGSKPYAAGSYNGILRKFSGIVRIIDSQGRHVNLSHTHRFRHTRLTDLAGLVPLKVLQRYAGHASPTMTAHYIAAKQEQAELAFLATIRSRSGERSVSFSPNEYDSVHLQRRADKFLPHGWCLLPPAQTCDKGNACLTCSSFGTDATHVETLERQLSEIETQIANDKAAYEKRHGESVPEGHEWFKQRYAERDALRRILIALENSSGRAIRGAGCPGSMCHPPVAPDSTGPVEIGIDLQRHRRSDDE
jgi:hypothetical protein